MIRCAVIIMLLISGCASVTMKPLGGEKISTAPTFEESKRYNLFWLIGENRINVRNICNGNEAKQIQGLITFRDFLFTTWTLGIYSPYTIRIWC